jgi:DNA-binding transcriptional LysR family regulator
MLTFRHISHVLALQQYGSFRKAASSLNISNPAFSRSIARAEEILGERLFDREPEGAVPTIFGQLLIERGQALLDGKEDIVREFNLMRGIDSGEIVIAAGPYAAEISGYLAAARMLGRYPSLKIRVLTCRFQEATERVLRREADLAYAETSDADQEYLQTEAIGNSPFVFFVRAGHPLTKIELLSKHHFMAYPLVLSRLPERLVHKFPFQMRVESHRGTKFLVPPIDCLDTKMSRLCVRESDAVSVATLAQIKDGLQTGVFQVLPFWQDWMYMQYGFAFLKGRSLVPAAEVFMAEARKLEQALAKEGEQLWREYFPATKDVSERPYTTL